MIERPLYLNKIMPFVDTPFVKILTGVRRCGKSTILKMIQKKLKEEHHITGEQILSYRLEFHYHKSFMLTLKMNVFWK